MPAPVGKSMLEKLGIKNLANTLYKIPAPEKGVAVPHTNVYHKDAVHQADILYLPHDKVGKATYKYALVVVDLASGLTDSEPLQEKSSADTVAALQVIYRRGVLNYPNRMETDPGSEFRGSFEAHLKAKGIELRYGKKGRHRQQSVAEMRNYAIGYALNLRMAAIEEITGQTNREWVSFLPIVISSLNEQIADRKPKPDQATGVRCSKKGGCKMLEVGTKVRVLLEEPVDHVTGKQLHGKFRAGDKRWDDRVRTVYQQVIRPDQPLLYIVTQPNSKSNKPEKVAYTLEQLQLVDSSKPTEPDARKLDISEKTMKAGHFRVHSIQEKRGNKYLVRWIGFPDKKDWTWESKTNLSKGGSSVKEMLSKF